MNLVFLRINNEQLSVGAGQQSLTCRTLTVCLQYGVAQKKIVFIVALISRILLCDISKPTGLYLCGTTRVHELNYGQKKMGRFPPPPHDTDFPT